MNLSHWVERWADFQPDKTAICFEGRDITYAEFDRRIRRAAGLLKHNLGVEHGDRIAFLGLNSPDMLALMFGCARIGALLVPLNWRLAPPEHHYILQNAGVKVLFCEEEFADGTKSIEPDIANCRVVAMGDDFERLVAAADQDPVDQAVGPDDPLLIVYTSGTTGRPKGAVLTQSAMMFNAVNSIAMHDMTSDDIIFTNLPMFHVGGLNIQTVPALHAGATVIMHRRFDPAATVEVIKDEKPTLMILVPALMAAIQAHPAWDDIDFSSLRAINTGSTTIPMSLLDAYLDRGVPIVQVYGSTETAPIVIHQRIPDAWTTKGSTGRPALYCDARIEDTSGKILGTDERGEIVVSGPNIMSGYWNDPEATAEVLQDGWFHTGDIGHMDKHGLFYIDDRVKDVIISGSENIYPAELEMILDRCGKISESAVVGRPDDKWGEVPVAIVVPSDDSKLSPEEVLSLFDGELARFKHPRDVIFRDKLPRNVMGKVLKFELRDMVSQQNSV